MRCIPEGGDEVYASVDVCKDEKHVSEVPNNF